MDITYLFTNPAVLPLAIGALIAGMVVSYLCGSIPVALIVGKLTKGIDVREHGSGNTGTTNALRTLGWGPGITVMVFDILKGSLGVLVMMGLLHLAQTALIGNGTIDSVTESTTLASGSFPDGAYALALLCAVMGHMFSPFMRFKGGKGIATAFGALVVILPVSALFVLVVFLIGCFASRYVSVGSISAAVALPVSVFIFYSHSYVYMVFTVLVTAVVIYAHRKNIERLLKGTERRFSVGGKRK